MDGIFKYVILSPSKVNLYLDPWEGGSERPFLSLDPDPIDSSPDIYTSFRRPNEIICLSTPAQNGETTPWYIFIVGMKLVIHPEDREEGRFILLSILILCDAVGHLGIYINAHKPCSRRKRPLAFSVGHDPWTSRMRQKENV